VIAPNVVATLAGASEAVSKTPPAVEMSAVSKIYGSLEVLRELSFIVPAGQRVAIIGPSGSGKTTVLRLLMGLERPTSGAIRIHGELLGMRESKKGLAFDERSLRRVRGQIGMVFQHFNLFPHKTALENVMEAPVRVRELAKPEARARAMELLSMVGLAEKGASYPRELSGGQQQRVAIARALAMEPRIMLFDEVTSALDPELVGEVLEVIRRLAAASQMTMILVTHEMSFARDVADRVVFMDHGRIVEDAAPAEIFGSPREERTRAFLRAVIERRPLNEA
jgi:polar amino acid transport system ATP-binding protein